MRYKKIFVCFLLLVQFQVIYSIKIDSIQYPALAAFYAKNKCCDDIAKKLRSNDPDVYNKWYQIERLINALRAQYVIEKHKLDSLAVPTKCLCSDDKRGTIVVVAEKVYEQISEKKLSLQEVQDLTKFVEETGFTDWGIIQQRPNIIRDVRNNKITFIDLENNSFGIDILGVHRINPDIPIRCKFIYLANLAQSLGHQIEEEALVWLQARGEELINSEEGKAPHQPLSKNTLLDDSKMNAKKIIQEYTDFISAVQKKEKR